MARFVLTADIGGTKIAAARVDQRGKITHSLELPTPSKGGRAAVQAVVKLLGQLPQRGVCALGVDVPGLAYPNGDVWAPNIPGWKKMPLGTALRREFSIPVIVESDRNAFVVGESWRGAARNCRDVVFLIVGTGVGAGILTGAHLLRGHAGLAGAVGWMAVRDQPLPEYRAWGCLEALASGPALGRLASSRLGRETTTRELAKKARCGDENAKAIIREAACHLGLGMANLVSVLNPEVIVVGGGVAALGELLLAPARKTMKRWAQPLAAMQVQVVRSRLGTRAALLGMAKLALAL